MPRIFVIFWGTGHEPKIDVNFGFWSFDFGGLEIGVLILDLEVLILDLGVLILDLGVLILDFGVLILGVWILEF